MIPDDLSLGLGAALLWLAILAWSDRVPARRLWPPHRGGWYTALWAWGLTVLIYAAQIGAAADAWNALGWPGWLRHGVGGGVSVLGSLYQSWAVAVIGLKGTSGWPVPVVAHGPYAQMRHPQYAGQLATFAGIAIWAASPAAILIGLAGCLVLVVAARTEARHLRVTTPGYADYTAKVPGFGA